VILFAGILAGLETDPDRRGTSRFSPARTQTPRSWRRFVAEIALKIAAHGRDPLDDFRDGRNIFDFAIVALCLLPIGGPFAALAALLKNDASASTRHCIAEATITSWRTF